MIYIVLFGVLSLICILRAFSAIKLYYLVKNTPTTPIAQMSKGVLTEISGVISSASITLSTPLTNTPCVFYSLLIQERKRRGKRSRTETLVDESEYIQVVIEDDSGCCELILEDATLILDNDHAEQAGWFQEISTEAQEVLDRYDLSHKFIADLRFKETALKVGDSLYVLGEVGQGKQGPALMLGSKDIFIVGDGNEEKVLKSFKMKVLSSTLLAVLGISFGIFLYSLV